MGIDYGLGRTNIDHATGIRYGVINPHTVNPDALSDIYDKGDNLTYAASKDDVLGRIKDALQPILDDIGVLPYVSKYSPTTKDTERYTAALDDVVTSVWDSIEQDWNDRYQEDEDTYLYKHDDYVIQTSSLGLYVIKSAFYTFAAFCSPCAPGAGDLNTPLDDVCSGPRTYCLGHDWFDDSKAPYPVYRVADDTVVEP